MMFVIGRITTSRDQKITGDELSALVNQLIKSMLAIGAGFAPYDRPRRVVHCRAIAPRRFAIALHIQLLQIGGKTMQTLAIRQYCLRGCGKKVAIPDAQQCQNDWHILLQWRRPEMFVHTVGTCQQCREVVHTNGDGDGEANHRPQGITPTHPIPETEDIVFVDAKGRDRFSICRYSDKMLSDGGVILECIQQPLPRRVGVGHCLLGSKGF